MDHRERDALLAADPDSALPLKVAVLSFSPIARDGRVLRTIGALRSQGHDVTALGFGSRPPLDCAFIELPAPGGPMRHRAGIVATQLPANVAPDLSGRLHFMLHSHRAARDALVHLRPQVVHANDWKALPSATALQAVNGAAIIYDSHEFAVEEHADNRAWRLVSQRHTKAIEARFIGRARIVTTVSDGIADALQALYDLAERPSVIRNTPSFERVDPAPVDAPLRLLFHGVLKPGRGIEASIGAMRLLPNHHLILRGEGAPAYLRHLRALAGSVGLEERISFEPAVEPAEVVRAASRSHVGLFCAPLDTRHNRFAMPNKAFEYMMAGLAVVATANTELAHFLDRHGCGVVADACAPEAIANAVGDLDAVRLSRLRMGALHAAAENSWDREQEKLVRIIDRLPHPS
ncbi:glycosyltransferase [Aureimonas leprariae]|uniref:glycosyltransferase n=1 Tax=Plantimonas leprariae TaxID=2615207 RepID=UPI00138682AE|nr:glycosyltransferase [Aureimonas leprariae]